METPILSLEVALVKIQGCAEAFYVNLVTITRAKVLRKWGVLAPPQLAAGAAAVRVWPGL